MVQSFGRKKQRMNEEQLFSNLFSILFKMRSKESRIKVRPNFTTQKKKMAIFVSATFLCRNNNEKRMKERGGGRVRVSERVSE